MVGILLLQDFIAIFMLAFFDNNNIDLGNALRVLLAFPVLIIFAYLTTKFILIKLIARFDHFKEYILLLAIGWCLGLAALAAEIGLSDEIGAFVAGVSPATSPIALFIAYSLKPLRDLFLILLFFSLGAQLNIGLLSEVIASALLLAALGLSLKPIAFRYLLRCFSERNRLAWDAGLRLRQISEFSLLIAFVATQPGVIGELASLTIQAAAIVSFLIFSYIVVLFCPTSIAINSKLRRDCTSVTTFLLRSGLQIEEESAGCTASQDGLQAGVQLIKGNLRAKLLKSIELPVIGKLDPDVLLTRQWQFYRVDPQ